MNLLKAINKIQECAFLKIIVYTNQPQVFYVKGDIKLDYPNYFKMGIMESLTLKFGENVKLYETESLPKVTTVWVLKDENDEIYLSAIREAGYVTRFGDEWEFKEKTGGLNGTNF